MFIIKHSLILILFLMLTTTIINASIDVRPAATGELSSILELDYRVTYEFFKPLFIDTYNKLGIKKNVDHDLEEELKSDAQTFSNSIQANGLERLHVSWDTVQSIACGLLVFHKEENNGIMLDLLLVDKNYRNQGIGKKLVISACKAFDDIKTVTVYPLQFNNENTLKFYKSLGFKNLGAGPSDKINSHGIRYSDMYYYFKLDIFDKKINN